MIDFHSHILPGIDDGSQSVQESLDLLDMLKKQNVDLVCATPHFYMQHQTVEQFLKKRETSFLELRASLPEDAPAIRLGAEVHYFSGISHLEELPLLCLENSRILLLEMPMCTWTNTMLQELTALSCSSEITVLLAHVERYLSMQKAGLSKRLLAQDILFQFNASFFVEMHSRRKAMKMLKNGMVSAVGSDCHDLSHRPPRMDAFEKSVRKKCSDDFFAAFDAAQYRFLEESACVRNI